MFRTDSKLSWRVTLPLSLIPFVLLVAAYLGGAHYLRYQAAHDPEHATASTNLMPTATEMWDGFYRAAFKPDKSGNLRLVMDIQASLTRFAYGMGIVSLAIVVGLYMGCFPVVDAFLYRFFVGLDKISPMVILPLLFVYLGVGEMAKVMLVVIGLFPGVALAARNRVKEINREQFDKAKTLGLSDSAIAWTLILPQIFPRMLGCLRDNFKSAWNYVIAGESVVAFVGIGYRIFLLRRNVAMDEIIPYVIVATLVMFALDFLFQWLEKRYRWVDK
jgi:NitT/TauT family transport system permease protein